MPTPATVIDARPKFVRSSEDRGRRRSRVKATALVVVLVVVVVWSALAGRSLEQAHRDVHSGRAALQVAETMTSDADVAAASAVPLLRQGSARLTSARDRLDSALLTPLRYVPVVGRQLRSVRDMTNGAAAASSALASALTTLQAATASPPAPDGRIALLQIFEEVVASSEAQVSGLDLGPRTGLLASVASARTELDGQVGRVSTGLARAASAGRAGLDLLQGGHRVLLLLTDDAQMAAGSGTIAELAVLQIDNGRLAVEDVQPVGQVPIPAHAVAATGGLASLWGGLDPTGSWRRLLLSPRFDETAPLAASMWVASGHPPVDGVMVVDPFLLEALLAVTGPVEVSGRSIDAAHVVADLLHDQYVQAPGTARSLPSSGDEIGALLQATVARIDRGGWSARTLGLGLAAAARDRDVMVWAASPADEALWQTAGAGGSVGPDSVMVSVINRSGDEGDQFLHVGASLRLAPGRDTTSGTLTVVLDDETPPGQGPVLAGPTAGVQAFVSPGQVVSYGDYVGILAVTLPQDAADVRLVGVARPAVYGSDGPTFVVGQQVLVANRHSSVVEITFFLPRRSGALTLQPVARFPAMIWNVDGGVMSGDSAHLITW